MKGALSRVRLPLPLGVAAGALVFYATLVPLGLGRVAVAPFAAAAIRVGGAVDPATASPLAILLAAAVARLPLGDLPIRIHLASAFVGALALALLAVFVRDVLLPLRPRAQARLSPRDFQHEPVVQGGAIVVVAVSPAFALGVSQGGALAISAALVVAGLLLAARLMVNPDDDRTGLGLAFLCGVSAGVDPLVSAILWPPAALLWIWALRRGRRWPVLAPFVFMVGAVVLLLLVVAPVRPRADIGVWFDRMTLHSLRMALDNAHAVRASDLLTGVSDDLGVVVLVLAAWGVAVMLRRAPGHAALVVFALWVTVLITAATPAGDPRFDIGRALLALLAAPALAAGVAHLSAWLGRARVAAAVAIMFMAVINPLWAGGRERWRSEPRLPTALLDQAHRQAAPGARVDPGSDPMRALFRYGAALGLRPDLHVDRTSGRGHTQRSR